MKRLLIVLPMFLPLFAASCQRETAAEPAKTAVPENEVWVTPKQAGESGIRTDVVAQRPLGTLLTATGRVTFSDSHVAHVFSPVTGRITRFFAGLGDRVRRGDPLALIESPDVGSAVSDLEKAEADLAAAKADYGRQKELYEAHAAAQRDFEAAEAEYRKAKAERDRAAEKSHLLLASNVSATTQEYVLRSPIDGQVVSRSVTPGMEVQGQYSGGSAAELFTVGSLDRLWVLADVFEVDLPRVKIGAPVTVSVISYPDRQFVGTIDWISGSLDPATRTAKVRCAIDNRGHLLRPEMYATVSISTEGRARLSIPRSAVVRLGDQMVVFVDRGFAPNGERRFERRMVDVDETEAVQYVPVIRGLNPGERVVSSGAVILSGSAE